MSSQMQERMVWCSVVPDRDDQPGPRCGRATQALTVRADSAFYSKTEIATAARCGVRVSITFVGSMALANPDLVARCAPIPS